MSNNVREVKVVMTFELDEELLGQTKYKKNALEELLIDLLEGNYKEEIFYGGDEISSPIWNVSIGLIDDK